MSLQAPDHVSGCHCQHDMNANHGEGSRGACLACGSCGRGRLSQNHVELFGV